MTVDDRHRTRLVHALEASREVDALAVRVAVDHAVVTVSGEVGSAAERLAVRSIMLSDSATTDIVDELKVASLPGDWRLSDEEIVALVTEQLGTHPELAGVSPHCDYHVVHLTGVVADPEHRRVAHHLTRTTRGVHFVIDRIETLPSHRTAAAPAEP
jgi:osmotically-inducible protein OsmY